MLRTAGTSPLILAHLRKRQEAGSLRRELAVAVANAIAAKVSTGSVACRGWVGANRADQWCHPRSFTLMSYVPDDKIGLQRICASGAVDQVGCLF